MGNLNIDIATAPNKYKRYLRMADAHDGAEGYNDKLDTKDEADTAISKYCLENRDDCAKFLEYLEKSGYSYSKSGIESVAGKDVKTAEPRKFETNSLHYVHKYPFNGAEIQYPGQEHYSIHYTMTPTELYDKDKDWFRLVSDPTASDAGIAIPLPRHGGLLHDILMSISGKPVEGYRGRLQFSYNSTYQQGTFSVIFIKAMDEEDYTKDQVLQEVSFLPHVQTVSVPNLGEYYLEPEKASITIPEGTNKINIMHKGKGHLNVQIYDLRIEEPK